MYFKFSSSSEHVSVRSYLFASLLVLVGSIVTVGLVYNKYKKNNKNKKNTPTIQPEVKPEDQNLE